MRCIDCQHCKPFASTSQYAGSYYCDSVGEGLSETQATEEQSTECEGFLAIES